MAREIEFAFPLAGGLHARPAALLREAASGFESAATFVNRRSGTRGSARSTLALLGTLTRHLDACSLVVEGADEQTAAETLRQFVEDVLPHADDALAPRAPEASEARPLPRVLRSAPGVHCGIAASGGVGRGPVVLLDAADAAGDGPARDTEEGELAAFARARDQVKARLAGLRERARGAAQRDILAAQVSMLEDEEFASRVATAVRSGATAAAAVRAAAEHFAGVLRQSGSAVLGERVLDLRDLAAQLRRALDPAAAAAPVVLARDGVGVAEGLGPAELLALDTTRLRGLALATGGTTSHAVILARALGLPCVTGLTGIEHRLAPGAEVIVDGERGLLIEDPSPEVLRFYEGEARRLDAERQRAEAFRDAPGATADGRRVAVCANVGSLEEARLAFACGAEGIGVFRTELLFLGRAEAPSEDEQARVYSETVQLAAGRPVVIRTLDVGADKPVPYLGLAAEPNPALGYRAIRAYGEQREVVRAQLRAILRASAHGPVEILFPMVGSVGEVRTLRGLVDACRDELRAEGIAFAPRVPIGVMVEVPAAALVLDQLAAEVDFFSVGTNDLTQYVLAVDRGNERVSHLFSALHPAVLRLLAKITADARAAGRPVALCGDLGGSARAAPLLVGLGFDELSVAPTQVAAQRAALARVATADGEALLARALREEDAAGVEALLRGFVAGGVAASGLVDAGTVRVASAAGRKEEVIRELVDLLRVAGRVADPDAVEDAIWRREDVAPTAVGFGFALPHCASPDVLTASLAVMTLATPVAWGGPDEEPVDTVVLIAVGAGAGGDEHLRTIATLSRRLADDLLRERLRAAPDAAALVAELQVAVAAR